MSAALDRSLDDLIKSANKPRSGVSRGRRGGRNGSAPGPVRRLRNRSAYRAAPYTTAKAPQSMWQHGVFTDRTSSTKLYISNLDYGVSNEDIKELFSEVGELKKYGVHYDRSGRSKGTAEVIYVRGADALAAVKRYNNVQLDGKPMKIELVAPPAPAIAFLPQAVNGTFQSSNGLPRGAQDRGGPLGRSRGGGGGGHAFGRGRRYGRGRGRKLSVADLDADLEKYHSELDVSPKHVDVGKRKYCHSASVCFVFLDSGFWLQAVEINSKSKEGGTSFFPCDARACWQHITLVLVVIVSLFWAPRICISTRKVIIDCIMVVFVAELTKLTSTFNRLQQDMLPCAHSRMVRSFYC